MARHLLPSFFFLAAAGLFLVIACERPLNAEAAGEEHEPPAVLALRWEVAEAPLALTLEKVEASAEVPDPAEGLLLEHRLRLQALELRCADLHLHDPTARGAQQRDTCAERVESAREELKRLKEELRRAEQDPFDGWAQRQKRLDGALEELDRYISARLGTSRPAEARR